MDLFAEKADTSLPAVRAGLAVNSMLPPPEILQLSHATLVVTCELGQTFVGPEYLFGVNESSIGAIIG